MKQLLLPVVWRTRSSVRVRPHLGLLAVLLSLGTQAQAQLAVTSTSPARNTNLAPRPTNVALTYSQQLTASNTPAVHVFSRQAGGRKAGSVSTSGSTLTVNPSVDFKPGETVSVTSVGSASARSYVYQFTTQAGAGPGTFGGTTEVGAIEVPTSVATADVDGDGDLDLLVANSLEVGMGTVNVHLNNGLGSFSKSLEVSVGKFPSNLVAADVDGDGDLDMLVTNAGSATVSVRLNNGQGSFSSSQEVSVGNRPFSVVAADVDGDGDLDLLTANFDSNTSSVRLNNGQGSFGGGSDVPVGTNPISVAAADLDGDGDLDLLASNFTSNTISARMNTGTGTFGSGFEVPVGTNPSGLVLADVDGDGTLDLLVANQGSGSVTVVPNKAGGLSSTITVEAGPSSIAPADVDGDGDLDLLVNSRAYNTVSVLLNNSQGNFSVGPLVSVGAHPYSIAAADVDNDGDLDLLTTNLNSSSVSVRLNRALPPTITSFTPASSPVGTRVTLTGTAFAGATRVTFNGVAASFTVNSATELVATVPVGATSGFSTVTTPIGTATSATSFNVVFVVTSTSPARNTNLAPRPTNVALTYSQQLTASNTPAVHVFSRQACGRKVVASTVSGNTLTVNPATDFKPGEMVSVTSVGSASVAPYVYQFTTRAGAGPGTFNGGSEVSVGRGPRGVITADIDGDGDLDLLTANDIDNTVSVRLNNGQGSFTSNGQDVNADTPTSIAAADVDGDGDLDLLVTNEDGGSVSVRLNNGAGSFSNAPDVAVGARPYGVVAADMDGDGDLDLLTANFGSSSVSIRLNYGTGRFSPGPDLQLGSGSASLAVGDVDGDGDLDLLVPNFDTNSVNVRLNNGSGAFSNAPDVSVDRGPAYVTTADVDADGDLDIVTVNEATVSVRLNNGAGSFGSGSNLPVGDLPASVVAADVDGDGDLDLLVNNYGGSNYNVGIVNVRLNNGAGTFSNAPDVAVGTSPRTLAVADVDGDGDLDLLTGNYRSPSSVSVRLNQVPSPIISGITPSVGVAGTRVTITGANFTDATSVTFNGVAATVFTVNSATELVATVPAGATTGPIRVTTALGTGTSTTAFTVMLTLVSTNPVRNTNLASRATDVSLTYDQPVDPAAAPTVRVFSQQAGGLKAVSAPTVSGNTLTLNPTADFKPGETILVTSAGSASAVPSVYQFITQAGTGPGTFNGGSEVSVGSGPTSIAPADVDNDGDLDLLVANINNTISVRLNQGNGTFTGTQDLALAGSHTRVRTADVNGDGNLDLLVANEGGTVSVRLGDGVGGFAAAGQEVPVSANTQDLVLADLDGDGDVDLATANGSTATVTIRLNDGTGTFSGTASYTPGPLQLYSLAAGDVDNDGDLDLLVGSANTNQVAVLLNGGIGTFSVGTAVSIATATYSLALADVDKDGNLDLVAATAGAGANTVSVRRGTGLGTFVGTQEVTVGTNISAIALADVEGDGDLDLLATLFDDRSVSVRLNNGSGTFLGGRQVSVGQNNKGLAVADLDGDGDLDLLTTSYLPDGTVSVRLNQVLEAPAPTLTSFTPTSSPAGTVVTLTGTDLSGVTSVTFNGVDATAVTSISATQVVATVPTGATTGLLALTTPAGTATSTTPFTVTFAPVLTTTAGPTSAPEQVATVIDAGLTITDADSPTLASAAVSISAGLVSSQDELAFPATSGIMGSYVASTGVLTLTGSASVAQWQTLLRGVTYRNTSPVPTTAERTLSFVVNDGALASAPATKVVQVQAVNSAPTVPTDANPAANTVAENAAVGTLVGLTALATDPDSPTLTYTLTNNAGGRFAINASSGVVTVANGALLDFETAPSYTLTVQASDGALTSAASFTIQLTNVNEVPVIANQTFAVAAGSPAGTVVGTVAATDPDAGITLTYRLTSGNASGAFAFVGNQLQVANTAALTSTRYALGISVLDNGVPALAATATLTVTVTLPPTSVRVAYQNADLGQATNNVIKPNLQLVNTGAAVPYQELTVRYWLTVENYDAIATTVYYAQLGTSQVAMRYVALSTPRQGAFGYVEYSFLAGAGTLAARGTSGPIQTGINKQSWTNFDETDDYSYAASSAYALTERITVYRKGILVGGTEPAPVAENRSLKVYAENKVRNLKTNTLSLGLQVGNVGNVPVDYQDVTVRYWFSPDGTSPLVYTVDYSPLGASNVRLSTGQQAGETYMQMGFAPGLGMLYPTGNTGTVQLRINKADWSNFDQGKDYSYRPPAPLAEHPRMTVYVRGQLVYGTEPFGGTRAASTANVLATEAAANRQAVLEAYPNPFAATTTVRFQAAQAGAVQMQVYNNLGQLVTTLYDGLVEASQVVERTLDGANLPAGVYSCRLTSTHGQTLTRRLVLTK